MELILFINEHRTNTMIPACEISQAGFQLSLRRHRIRSRCSAAGHTLPVFARLCELQIEPPPYRNVPFSIFWCSGTLPQVKGA